MKGRGGGVAEALRKTGISLAGRRGNFTSLFVLVVFLLHLAMIALQWRQFGLHVDMLQYQDFLIIAGIVI